MANTTLDKNKFPELVATVDALPDGPEIAAIFDFDGTIISGYSALAFMREQLKRGDFSLSQFTELATAMTRFGIGDMGFSAMMAITMQFLRDASEADYAAFAEYMFEHHIARLIYPEARALIAAHQAKGHTVAIVSSATPYQVAPAARELGVTQVRCTELEIIDGVFTGAVIHPTCFGPGKVRAAHSICDATNARLADSVFYSDSDDDIELMEAVGKPRPLNPNKRLTTIAKHRGWPIARFESRGRPSIATFARSVAATGSLAASFAAALPILALTGSRRKMQNFSYALFAETASALIGLDLEIHGEEHLWSQRPAVFIFNHQSKADVVIVLKLLRRDLAGVGKQEIRNIPIIGQVMQLGGAVLIDRKNTRSAVAAMRPLVDIMQTEGKSVVMAPEGTRTVTPKLNPFKKGAFHLAMQAGVPVVPVVIHNSLDVAPKGDFVFRPAKVRVDVLPPVQTDDWHKDTIDVHVAEVRNQFLEALGQETMRAPKKRKKRKAATKSEATRKTAKATTSTRKKAKRTTKAAR
ncbi:MAG: HAD-IB family hydrolase [Pseudomonadota bacterium]